MFFRLRVIWTLDDDHTLAGNKFLEPVWTCAEHMLLVGDIPAKFVEHRLARDDESVTKETEQRRRRLISGESYSVLIDSLRFDNGSRHRCLLLGLWILDDSIHHRMDNVIRGHLGSIVEAIAFIQIEEPRVRVLYLPTLGQASFEIPFVVIVGAKWSGDFAPNAVQERDAVAVRIECLNRFRDAD